jgi:hypothetical protein
MYPLQNRKTPSHLHLNMAHLMLGEEAIGSAAPTRAFHCNRVSLSLFLFPLVIVFLLRLVGSPPSSHTCRKNPALPGQVLALSCMFLAAGAEYHIERFLKDREDHLRTFIKLPEDDKLDGNTACPTPDNPQAGTDPAPPSHCGRQISAPTSSVVSKIQTLKSFSIVVG